MLAAVTVTFAPLALRLPVAVPLVPATTLPTAVVAGVAVSSECPYRGLAAFRPNDSDRFFGREQLTALRARSTVLAAEAGRTPRRQPPETASGQARRVVHGMTGPGGPVIPVPTI